MINFCGMIRSKFLSIGIRAFQLCLSQKSAEGGYIDIALFSQD